MERFSTDKEQTEVDAYNPVTKSNINFDFTPTGRYARFNQKKIEALTSMATESMKAELDKEFGKGVVKPDVSPTEPISLKGVQDAAKKYATYTAKDRNGDRDGFMDLQNPIKFLSFTRYSKRRWPAAVRI